jgi:putative hydrolase of the HAD superfamily
MVDFPEYFGPMALWPHVAAVESAAETLERLRDSGLHTALATNAADSDEVDIRAALARVGLDDLIDRVYCSRDVGHLKPSAAFFAFIERDLGLVASDLIMVGDNYEIDVLGANDAAIRAVWLSDRSDDAADGEMRRVVTGLDELPDLLRSWTRTI